jgi:hypothetical protein
VNKKDYITNDIVVKILSVCLATKINFFSTNHHTGQGKMTDFMTKMLTTLYPDQMREAEATAVTAAIHQAGHWMSTHVASNTLGMFTGSIITLTPVSCLIGQASDFITRPDALPSSTTPYAIVYFCMRKFGTHKAWIVAPHTADIINACENIKTIINGIKPMHHAKRIDPRLEYHVGVIYVVRQR